MTNPLRSTLFLVAALMGFSIAALVAVVVASSQGIDRLSREEDREIREAIALIEGAYQLKVAYERQLVGLHGFVATGDDRLLAPWREGRRDFERVSAGLESRIREGEHRRLIDQLRDVEARHLAYGERLIALRRAGRAPEAQALVSTSGVALKAEAIALANALIALQRAQVAGLHDEVNRVEGQVRHQLWLWALVSVPITLLLAASIAWRVVVPLRSLAEASKAIARGDMHMRVTPLHHDEFGEVARAFNTMAEAVERSVVTLRESNEELVRVDRYKDDFLSMVTHELKTPLTAILGFARLLERGRHGPLSDEQRESMAKIVGNASRMRALVDDLLDQTAIRQGRLELALAPTPYRPLLDEAVAQVQALALQKRITLSVSAPDGLAPHLDGVRMAQVLANLLSNALKFTPEGGAVSLEAVREGDRLRTTVTDTGPGIAEADRSRLFQPFSKLSRATGGTGLGLSISRAIVEAHGGRMGAESTPGRGSAFWFTLPL
jgi:signal transduction histidine kinase